jgi:hypothetical protein
MAESSLGEIDAKFEATNRRFDGIDQRLDGINRRLDGVDQRLDTLTSGQEALRLDVQGLGREMRVLHEDTIDKIVALAPDFAPIRREFTEADRVVRDDMDRRLVPLEAAVRSISQRRPKKPR